MVGANCAAYVYSYDLDGEFQSEQGDFSLHLFGIARCIVCTIVRDVCKAIIDVLSLQYIKVFIWQ